MLKHKKLTCSLLTAMLIMQGTVLAAPVLKLNSHGRDVLKLQQMLINAGYTVSTSGIYDQATSDAVKNFQELQNLKITGNVDGQTWHALEKAPNQKEIIDKADPYVFPEISSMKTTTKAAVKKTFITKSQATQIISTAKKYIGRPYVFGGNSPKGFDCSGYLQYVFAENGISLPRTADDQYKIGITAKNKKQLVPGDLVFFTTYAAGASHCGLYLGNDKFIHTSSSKGVRIDELKDAYWQPRYLGGKHIVK